MTERREEQIIKRLKELEKTPEVNERNLLIKEQRKIMGVRQPCVNCKPKCGNTVSKWAYDGWIHDRKYYGGDSGSCMCGCGKPHAELKQGKMK